MRPTKTRVCRMLIGAVLLSTVASCHLGYDSSDGHSHEEFVRADFLITDGETGAPINGAFVHAPAQWGDSRPGGKTNTSGHARIVIANYISEPWVEAPGYLSPPNIGPTYDRPDPIRVAMFKGPMPLAGLRIPKTYRGVLRVKEGAGPQPPGDRITWCKGQREFYTPVVMNGITTLHAPPNLSQDQPYYTRVFIAQFDDGSELRFENPTDEQGTSGEYFYFLPDIRDRIPPRPDRVALFKLGLHIKSKPDGDETFSVYFVGTIEAARVAQQEQIRDTSHFKPTPLSRDDLDSTRQFSPHRHGT